MTHTPSAPIALRLYAPQRPATCVHVESTTGYRMSGDVTKDFEIYVDDARYWVPSLYLITR